MFEVNERLRNVSCSALPRNAIFVVREVRRRYVAIMCFTTLVVEHEELHTMHEVSNAHILMERV